MNSVASPRRIRLASAAHDGLRGQWVAEQLTAGRRFEADAAGDGSGVGGAAGEGVNSQRDAAGAVGIWHETFIVERAESMYVSTPRMGLGAATALVPVGRRHDRAATRLAEGRTRAAA